MYSWAEIQVGTNDGSNDCDDLHLDSPQIDSVIERERGALQIKKNIFTQKNPFLYSALTHNC